jgi:hypothetical protein
MTCMRQRWGVPRSLVDLLRLSGTNSLRLRVRLLVLLSCSPILLPLLLPELLLQALSGCLQPRLLRLLLDLLGLQMGLVMWFRSLVSLGLLRLLLRLLLQLRLPQRRMLELRIGVVRRVVLLRSSRSLLLLLLLLLLGIELETVSLLKSRSLHLLLRRVRVMVVRSLIGRCWLLVLQLCSLGDALFTALLRLCLLRLLLVRDT